MECPSCEQINVQNSIICAYCDFDFSEINTDQNQSEKTNQPTEKIIDKKSDVYQWVFTSLAFVATAIISYPLIKLGGALNVIMKNYIGAYSLFPFIDKLYLEFINIAAAGIGIGYLPLYVAFTLAPSDKQRVSLIISILFISFAVFSDFYLGRDSIRAIIEGLVIIISVIFTYIHLNKSNENK